MILKCLTCGQEYSLYPPRSTCEKCGGSLEYELGFQQRKVRLSGAARFWKYRPLLPPVRHTVSLGEGGTPLHKAERLAKQLALKKLCLKDETRNPTNSYRDRAAALLTSNAVDIGAKAMLCATNGNSGASLAAYCAKAGLACHVIVPRLVDVGKLAQMLVYDAAIEEYGETVDDSIRRARKLAEETGWYQATAELNPLVIEAQKTISVEVAEQSGVPDWFVVSMGSGGTIYSVWKGFCELRQMGMTSSLPRMIGVQPDGCAPIVEAYAGKDLKQVKVNHPSTRALAILVGNPLQADLAINALKESRGLAISVSDAEIFAAELQIAKLEGMFAEPASSATIAALAKLVEDGTVAEDESVVCLITGSGLKATDVLQALTKKQKTVALGLEISTKEKILRMLSEEDSYGYGLWAKMGRTMTRAAVYQHLNELKSRGLVVAYERDGKRYFRITEGGRRVLRAMDDLKLLL